MVSGTPEGWPTGVQLAILGALLLVLLFLGMLGVFLDPRRRRPQSRSRPNGPAHSATYESPQTSVDVDHPTQPLPCGWTDQTTTTTIQLPR